MAASFFFYDLETSGLDPKQARIMQFAGQRTDMDLQPIDEPVNVLIKLAPDVLPSPDAILVTGITPQATLADGLTEAAFLRLFYTSVVRPGTIFLGYNSIRFDDEFMRYLHYRNFYDAYRWQWSDNCSRWDILDAVRMTRALRPEGITWPVGPDGRATNRLELLTKLNNLDHVSAHDALSDVYATIAVTRLLKEKQPKLFHFLLEMRDKKKVAALIQKREPFVYTSASYAGEYAHTTIATCIADLPNGAVLVYDLRYDPKEFVDLSIAQLAERLRWQKDRPKDEAPLPVKSLRFNRCPAVAPLSVVDAASAERIHLQVSTALAHAETLRHLTGFSQKILRARELLENERPLSDLADNERAVDGRLYDGFLDERDHPLMAVVQSADVHAVTSLNPQFHDDRLVKLWPLYKARNFPASLTAEEREAWDMQCTQYLLGGGKESRLAAYFERLQTLLTTPTTGKDKQYLLEELRLYGESLAPLGNI